MNVKEFDQHGLWHYRGRYVRVIDGDTIAVLVDQGRSTFAEMHIRLEGFSTEERYTPGGKIATQRMRDVFASDRYTGAMLETRYWPLRVHTIKRENGDEVKSFERWIGRVYLVSEDGELTDLVELLS